MRKLVAIGISLMVFILFSCSPIREMNTDVLEPAGISFPEDVYSVGILMPEPEVTINTRTYDEIEATPGKELWTGITDIAAISPRFNVRALNLLEEYTDTIRKDTVEWSRVKRITDSIDVDALMVFHRIKFSDSLEREIVYDYDYEGFYFVYQIHSLVEWKIYEPTSQSIFNEHTYEEQFVWEALGGNEREAIRELVGINEAFSSAAYWSGNDIGHILFPYWIEESRFYYIRGNRYFRHAREEVENNNWQKAIDIWKKNFKLNSEDAAYRAAHNIAFACEMLGKIDLAIEWAEKALDIGYTKRTSDYLDKLQERKEKLEKIDQQMPI
ncbi:MAG: DUF6340 family protein [Bacteroidales bacterium]|nr:tetratricopeptide repeat protein [Bacteroidales bacterium]